MVRPQQQFTFNYETLMELTGLAQNALVKHRTRGNFDPERLDTVLLFIARHGTPELRMALIEHAIFRELPKPLPKVKRAAKTKGSR